MNESGRTNGRSRLLAALLSFLLPGAGQLFLGRAAKGLLLLAGTLADIAAIVHYAGVGDGRYLLLIVYLGLALPVIYFYSMFDVLQGAVAPVVPVVSGVSGVPPKPEPEKFDGLSPLTGAAVAGAGLLLLLLVKPPASAEHALQLAGDYAASSGVVGLGALLLWRRGRAAYRLGRITAALTLLAVGCLLLWDRLQGTNGVAVLGDWWPVLFVALGAEIAAVTLGWRRRRERGRGAGPHAENGYGSGPVSLRERRIVFDTGGLAAALVVAIVTYSVTQLAGLPFKWIEGLNANLAPAMTGLTDESGYQYEKPQVGVELAPDTRRIEIENPNGRVEVKQGSGTTMTVDATVWVDLADKAEADKVAGASMVSVSGAGKLRIEAKGERYDTGDAGGKRIPRINLVVTMPKPASTGADPLPGTEAGKNGGGPAAGPAAGAADAGEPAGTGVPALPGDPSGAIASGAAAAAAETGAAGSAAGAAGSAPGAGHEAGAGGGAADLRAGSAGTAANSGAQQSGSDAEGGGAGSGTNAEKLKGILSMDVSAANGMVDISGLALPEGLTVKNTDGEISIRLLKGSVQAETRNGAVKAREITGSIHLRTFNGDVSAGQVGGDAVVETSNGSIALEAMQGNVEANTENGGITAKELAAELNADTLNGRIDIRSSTVGGAWDVGSSVGEIRLYVPERGDYAVTGSVTFGSIQTDLPLEVSEKVIRGRIGKGTYRISIDANNSIFVNALRP